MAGIPAIVEKADAALTLKALQDQFDLSDKVMTAFKASKADSLTELRFMFANEEEVGAYVRAIKELEDVGIMVARVRHMWYAIRQQASVRESCKSRVDTADLDDMLDDEVLVDAKNAFWRRHKLRFPPEIMPADSLVSRCSREMSKRMLMVFNVHTAKNLKYQVTTSKKRKRLADDLYTEQEEVTVEARDASEYLDKLTIYMLALAVAGISQINGSEPAKEAAVGVDTTLHVQVPLDVAWSYVWRAKKASGAISAPRRLAWLERQDIEDRTQWVADFRDSTDTLGAVVKRVMVTRDAHWSPVEAPENDAPVRVHSAAEATPEKIKRDTQPRKPPQQQEIKLSLLNGEKICPAFQKGSCRTQGIGCAAGLHKCAVMTSKSGRVCGMSNHGANNHPTKGKGKGKN